MKEKQIIKIIRHPHGADIPLPSYATHGSSGLDLMAAIEASVTIEPTKRILIPTGISIVLPKNFEGQIRPRSGLAFKHGITVLNAPGTIDQDYQGELKVLLINLGSEAYEIKPHARIAQLVIAAVTKVTVELLSANDAKKVPPTHRSDGGFGSTGT